MKNKIIYMTALCMSLLFCMTACGTKETVLLETKDIVMEEEPDEEIDEQEAVTEPSVLLIHICGAVKAPGVYELPAGSRVSDAVQAAGGFQTEADEDYVNLAEILQDGWKINIFTKEETEVMLIEERQDSAPQDGKNEKSSLVNINTASEEELCSLPGIGKSRAQNITAYREKNGSFSRIEDIMNIEGIKEGMFEKLKDWICVR